MFNASNGSMIGAVPSGMDTFGLDPNEVKIKLVEYDADTHVYYGDYATGSVKSINELDDAPDAAIIDEEYLNKEIKDDIQHVYPLYRQLNIMMDMLDKSDIPNTEEFTQMMSFIKDQLDKNSARKQAFKSNPSTYKFVSKQDIQKSRRRRLGLD